MNPVPAAAGKNTNIAAENRVVFIMKAVIQRVSRAEVKIDGKVISEIGKGLVIFLGVEKTDGLKDAEFLAGKITELRCFDDQRGKMNISVREVNAELLVVSEVTLCTGLASGRRPGFENAAQPEEAKKLYHSFIKILAGRNLRVREGRFKAHMIVTIFNDGPVTFVLDSRKKV